MVPVGIVSCSEYNLFIFKASSIKSVSQFPNHSSHSLKLSVTVRVAQVLKVKVDTISNLAQKSNNLADETVNLVCTNTLSQVSLAT